MTIARTTKILLLSLLPISLLTTLLLLQSHHSHHRNFHYTDHYQLRSAADHCSGTLYPDLCISTLSTTVPDLHKKSLIEVIRSLLNTTLVPEVRRSASNCSSLLHHRSGYLTPLQHRALDDCLELFASTLDELKAAAKDMATRKVMPIRRHYHDIQTLLSGAMTNQYTCMDGFAVENSTVRNIRNYIQPELLTISHHFSNSLAMLKKTRAASPPSDEDDTDEDTTSYRMRDDGFPTWMMGKDRRLLQAATNKTKVDVVVAKDGTGSFRTIGAAVGAARNKSTTRYVIYIKAGTYFENVEVDKKKTNIMFLGDGIGKTVIKGNRNVVDGFTTFHSATVAVVGAGFIAKGITFENYAGPTKHQAVALRSGSDLSAFYQCSFVGYQDTLYTHSLRQFYRDCDIYGTIDFIFGNAAVVFQNCNLYARKPLYNQKNIYTAQGREDPNQNTGISILNCKVAAASDLAANKSATKTYLGRPWREYSRTVYMLSYIDDVVDPAGWLEWNGTFALKTLYYGEYKNRGPGSNTSARVTWPGYRVINDSAEASGFTVGNLIQGGQWLPSYNIPFFLNLTT